MYGVNDVFDYESDLANPRKGGIEGALLEPQYHAATLWISALSCVPFVAYLLFVGNAESSVILLLVVFAVVAYSAKHLRFKEIPVLDSFTSALHFVGRMLFGLSLGHGNLLDPVVLIVTAAFLLWGMASHAFGAIQDIKADRQAKIASIATYLGARLTVRLAFDAYLVAGATVLFLPGRFWLDLVTVMAGSNNLTANEDHRPMLKDTFRDGIKHFEQLRFWAEDMVHFLGHGHVLGLLR